MSIRRALRQATPPSARTWWRASMPRSDGKSSAASVPGDWDVIAIFRKGNQWGTKKSFQDITISLCFLSFFKYMGESGNPWGSKRTSMGKSLGNQWMYIRLFLSTGSWCGPFWDIPYLWNMWLIRCEWVYNTYMWKYYSSINFCDIICIYCRKWVELTTLKQIWDSCTATSLV